LFDCKLGFTGKRRKARSIGERWVETWKVNKSIDWKTQKFSAIFQVANHTDVYLKEKQIATVHLITEVKKIEKRFFNSLLSW